MSQRPGRCLFAPHPQAVSLLLQLNSRAARVFAAFRDEEVTKVLSALVALGQRDEELLAAMEKHLPGSAFYIHIFTEN